MDIRIGPELGLKNPASFKMMNQTEPPVTKEPGVPGNPFENKQFMELEKSQTAITPDQIKSVFQVKGTVIDIKA